MPHDSRKLGPRAAKPDGQTVTPRQLTPQNQSYRSQNRLNRQIGRFLKNLLQLSLHLLRNAIHGESSKCKNSFLSYDRRLS